VRADPATEGADLAHVMWIQPRVAAAAMDGPTKERARGRKVEEEVDWSPASAFPAAARASDGRLRGSETGLGWRWRSGGIPPVLPLGEQRGGEH